MIRTILAVLVAAALGLAPMTATADDQKAHTVTASNKKEARAIRSLVCHMARSQGARVNCSKRKGNLAVIVQDGSDHVGSIRQTGSDNAYMLMQFGQGTVAHVEQGGTGQAGYTVVRSR